MYEDYAINFENYKKLFQEFNNQISYSIQQSMSPIFLQHSQLISQLNASLLPLQNLASEYHKTKMAIAESLQPVFLTMNGLFSSPEFQNQIKLISKSIERYKSIIGRLSQNQIRTIIQKIDWNNVNETVLPFIDDNTINQSKTLRHQDVKEIVNEVLETSGIARQTDVNNAINELTATINSSNSLTKQIAAGILVSIITALLTLFFCHQPKELWDDLNQSKTQILNVLQEKTQKALQTCNIAPSMVKSYRFVSKSNVMLRTTPSTKSHLIHRLYFGDMVIVVQKKRNWTKIEIIREDETQIVGWTFTRYLKNIIPSK